MKKISLDSCQGKPFLEGENPQEKKLHFEVSGIKAKIMMMLGMLSAGTPVVAQNTSDGKDKKIIVADNPERGNPDKEFFSKGKIWNAEDVKKFLGEENDETVEADATKTVLSPEQVQELTDIIPLGAPEVFDDERTEPWKREVMKNHILKAPDGGNWSFFGANIAGEKRIFAITATHVSSGTPIGEPIQVAGDMFGFPTNSGGVIGFQGIVRGDFGPGDHQWNNKFRIVEITRFEAIEGELENPGPNDWKEVRTFPLASEPIDTTNPGYIGDFTQSGNWGIGPDPIPGYDPTLAERFVAPINLDPAGIQDPRTKMRIAQSVGYEGKTIMVPMQVFAMDSTNIGPGSSGGEFGQILDSGVTPGEITDKNATNIGTVDIVEDYRILGPYQGGTHPNDNGGVLSQGITLVQPYRAEIEAAIGGTLLDEGWDLEVNGVGETRPVGRVVDRITSVEEIEAPLPTEFKLEQNYPNPFNPETKIRFAIPQSEKVTLRVYNELGQEVAKILEGKEMHPGTYEETFNASEYGLASGVYFYRLSIGGSSETKKMILVK